MKMKVFQQTGLSKLAVFGLIVFVLFIIGMLANKLEDWQQQRDVAKATQIAAQEEKNKKDAFLNDIENQYRTLTSLIEDGKHGEANKTLALFRRYKQIGYKDVGFLDKKVAVTLLKQKIKNNQPENYATNLSVYNQLSQLEPDNSTYKKEVEFYKGKISERDRIEREKKRKQADAYQKRLAKFGSKPQNSAWDGSVSCVKQYLQSVAKDPDSLVYEKWGKVAYNDNDGWLVWCDFRGKNSFGGYKRDIKWFVIRHNNVVAVKDFDAYR